MINWAPSGASTTYVRLLDVFQMKDRLFYHARKIVENKTRQATSTISAATYKLMEPHYVVIILSIDNASCNRLLSGMEFITEDKR